MRIVRLPNNRFLNLDMIVHVVPMTRVADGEITSYHVRLVNGDEISLSGTAEAIANFGVWLDDLTTVQ